MLSDKSTPTLYILIGVAGTKLLPPLDFFLAFTVENRFDCLNILLCHIRARFLLQLYEVPVRSQQSVERINSCPPYEVNPT
jgi:hypothetical protein